MRERIPFLLLTVLSVVDGLFGAAVLRDVNLVALIAGCLLQLVGAVLIGFGDRIPATAGVTPLAVGSVLIIFDPGWRELYAHGALLWMPVATAIVTVNLVRLARRPAQFAVGAGGLAAWVVVAAIVMALDDRSVVTAVLAAAAPILSGACISLFVRLRRAQRDRLRQAQQERVHAAEQTRIAERQRLAEELHDTVTHRVTLLVMQANVLAATTADGATRTAAESIGTTGRTALEELREFLGVLSPKASDPTPDRSSSQMTIDTPTIHRTESSGVGDLAELIMESRKLHPELEFTESGSAAQAPDVVARTVFRVVQEALTNVHKHAPHAPASVTVAHGGDGVDLEIWNAAAPESAVADTGSGSGLAALQRRVQLLGGTFDAARMDTGDFVLTAQIPYQQGSTLIEE